MYFFFVLFALLLFSPSLRAQDSDVRSWTTVKVSRAVFSGATITGSFEYRTKDNITSTDRYGGQLSLGWKLSSLLKLGCGYEVHYQNKSSNGWKFRQRYHVDGTLTKKISLFNLSFRERFQHTFRKSEHDFRLRSRLKLQCVKDKFIASPYLSCEMYNNLCNNQFLNLERMRYRTGLMFKFTHAVKTDLFYCFQQETKKNIHILGIELHLSL